MKNIAPCLWFDQQAEPAAQFYATVFEKTKIETISRYGPAGAEISGQKPGSVLTVDFTLEDLRIEGLNGGPMFKFTPALSLFVSCATENEIDEKWKKLSAGGNVRMGLDKYPWAQKYGWTADRFGVEWQLMLTPRDRKIVPAFLFVDSLFGKGEEAVKFYTSLFPNSKIEMLDRDEEKKSVRFASFTLNGQGFVLMEGEGKHGYTFNEATSLIVNCDTQKEIDDFWQKLSAGGSTSQCGWLKDRYGVSWQIVPTALAGLMKDPIKADKVMNAFLKMTKLDLETLMQAAQ